MLKITRKFDYAMVLLTDLGLQGASPSSARQISQRHGLSLSLAANVLKGLQRRSLVRSIRGVHGGYILARRPEEISLGSILLAVDGDRRMTHCQPISEKGESRCPAFSTCPARGYINILENRIKTLFDDATLADVLLVSGKEKNVPSREAGVVSGTHQADRGVRSGCP